MIYPFPRVSRVFRETAPRFLRCSPHLPTASLRIYTTKSSKEPFVSSLERSERVGLTTSLGLPLIMDVCLLVAGGTTPARAALSGDVSNTKQRTVRGL